MPTYRAGQTEPSYFPPLAVGATRDFGMDWSRDVAKESTTMLNSTWSVEPNNGGLTLDADDHTPEGFTTLRASGVTAGYYIVTNAVGYANGEEDVRSAGIVVTER